MRRGFLAFVLCGLWACASGLGPEAKLAALWRPVALGADANRLKIEPLNSVARLGSSAHLRVLSTQTATADCKTADGEVLGGDAEGLVIPSPALAAPVEVVCKVGDATARAQVTFTDSKTLPVADPYAGGVALFKLRELGKPWKAPVGVRSVGLDALDPKLEQLGAVVLPAFPFDRTGTRDAVGIGLWVVVAIPEGVNYYQAVSWLRSDPDVHAESYLPEDAAFLRVRATAEWPAPLAEVTRVVDPDSDAYRKEARLASKRAMPTQASADLKAIGAPQVWSEEQGDGVRLAVIDTGIDIDHATLRPNLVDKVSERAGNDFDQNGVPGDQFGVNLAHLAIARSVDGTTRLGLGLTANVSDWAGADERTRRDWGHGTAVASIAAGSGAGQSRIGVAPRAQILAVDVQENLRTSLTQRSVDDPRMRNADTSGKPLRSNSTWARAAAIVYAVGERARVVTCAWPGQPANLILHDALLFAEDNCALAVCGPGDEPGANGAYPARWRESWLRKHGGGETGVVLDPWTGEELNSVLLRSLRGTLVAEVAPTPGTEADLVLPEPGGVRLAIEGAVSNPWNDGTTIPDKRTTLVTGSAGAVGLAAGAAVLVTGMRPDAEPSAIRQAMVDGGVKLPNGGRALSVPNALAVTGKLADGYCSVLQKRDPSREASPSMWPKVKLKVNPEKQGAPAQAPPTSPDKTQR